MKKYFLILLLFGFSCDDNFYGDINLGRDFYYMTEPAFNSIYIAKFRDSPYQHLGPYVVKDVAFLGFNDKIILVSNKINDSIKYFLIDKEKELKRNYEARLYKTNLIELDSFEFKKLEEIYKINIKKNEEYWKEKGWK